MAIDLDASDEAYEEDILRNPYSVKVWLRYLAHKSHASPQVRTLIFERALKQMPRRCVPLRLSGKTHVCQGILTPSPPLLQLQDLVSVSQRTSQGGEEPLYR